MSDENVEKHDNPTPEEGGEMSEREKELAEKVAQLEQDKANVVGELQEKRKAYQEVKEELEKKEEKPPESGDNPDPEEVVNRVLSKREQEAAKANFEQAKDEFRRKYPEFDPNSDSAGIVFDKFEKELQKFNLSNLSSKDDFINRFEEVYDFMQKRESKQPEKKDFYSGTPKGTGRDVPTDDGTALSSTEQKLIQEMGWTKEKYLEQKEKRPHYVASLLRYRSG